MSAALTPIDLVIFFIALIGVMAVGLIAGRKEETSEDYFLAGRSIPWWGVAGSIFASNVSANHMVGMMGIGFSIGFAQSHFELGAIFGLMALCYGFLPVYRKLRVYTLSEYLGRRYDDRSRLAYAVIMIVIMAVVQMVPGLYIGARSICVLMGNLDQAYYNAFVIALAVVAAGYTIFGGLKAVVWTDAIQSVLMLVAGLGVAAITFEHIGGWNGIFGGWRDMMALDRAGAEKMHLYRPMNDADLPWTGVFTGLMAMHCFYWGTNQFIVQRALGARSDSEARLGIVAAGFLKLLIPFFAIATGVAAFYLFRSEHIAVDPDAAFPELVKLVILPLGPGIVGLIAAGLIGAILSSIDSMMNSAATIVTIDVYKRYVNPAATDRQMIRVGRLSIAVFVTLAAMMAILVLDPNSKENFFLKIVDYSGYLTPGLLVAFLMGMFWRRGTGTAALVTILAGVLFSGVVELTYNMTHGMHPAVYSIVTGQRELNAFSDDELPQEMQQMTPDEKESYLKVAAETELTPVNALLGPRLNFFHRVVVVIVMCVLVHVVVSLMGKADSEKGRLVWTDLGGHAPGDLRNLLASILISIVVFAAIGAAMYREWLTPTVCAALGAVWTLGMFSSGIGRALAKRRAAGDEAVRTNPIAATLREDRFWAGILCALAVFMHYYFY